MQMDAVHEAAGLGTPQIKVLDVLERQGTATIPDIAAKHDISRQFVLTVCHALENKGLVTFSDNPRHRRSRLASLTDTGKAAVAQFHKAEAELITHALPGIDALAVAKTRELLRKIRVQIEGSDLGKA